MDNGIARARLETTPLLDVTFVSSGSAETRLFEGGATIVSRDVFVVVSRVVRCSVRRLCVFYACCLTRASLRSLQRPPSSSLSYPGAGGNDDARSPGSGGTPGPLSQQPPASLDSSDPGEYTDDSIFSFLFLLIVRENCMCDYLFYRTFLINFSKRPPC